MQTVRIATNAMHFGYQSRFFIVKWCSLIWKKCCLGHSTHLTPESLDHINFSTIIPFISHFHHWWSRFAQTRASSKYFELQVKRCQIKASISRQLQARALNSSSSVKHVVIMLSLVKWVTPFVSELRQGSHQSTLMKSNNFWKASIGNMYWY